MTPDRLEEIKKLAEFYAAGNMQEGAKALRELLAEIPQPDKEAKTAERVQVVSETPKHAPVGEHHCVIGTHHVPNIMRYHQVEANQPSCHVCGSKGGAVQRMSDGSQV